MDWAHIGQLHRQQEKTPGKARAGGKSTSGVVSAGPSRESPVVPSAIPPGSSSGSTTSTTSANASGAPSTPPSDLAGALFNASEVAAFLATAYKRLAADAVVYRPLELASQWQTKVDRRANSDRSSAPAVIRHDRLQIDVLFELNRLIYQQQRRK